MARNTFYKLGANSLHTFGVSCYSVVQNADPYAVPAPDLTALNNANSNLAATITAAQNAENAYHAAIAAKEAARLTLVDSLSTVAKVVYANEALTDAEIAATGFAVHDANRSPVVVYEVANAVINAYANGTATLEWDRNGNPYGVIFEIEASTNGSSWSLWTTTKKRRLTLSNVAPGVTRWFRIRAATSQSASPWCVPVAVYGPEESVQLQLAA